MNQSLFLTINGLAGNWHWLDVIGIFFAEKFLYVFALMIVMLWLVRPLRYYVYIALGSALITRLVVVEAIKRIINHPRPYEIVANIHPLLTDIETGLSFPSGHTVIYFSFAFAFWGTRYFWPFFILAVLGSLARIFVGVHFPVDIGASIIIAAAAVWILRRLFKKPVLG